MDEAAVFRAMLDNDVAAIEAFLKSGVSPDASALGLPLLFLAVSARRPQIVSLVLRKGANPNSRTANKVTPLMLAVISGCCLSGEACPSLEIVGLLIRYGADPNASDERGHTAYMLAVQNRRHAIAELLGGNSPAQLRSRRI